MNILLVYPEMPDTFYAMKHFIRMIGKKAAYPPLGLLTVASLLPSQWEKKLVDLNTNELSKNDLAWADYVFLSAMNVQEESVRNVIVQCKLTGTKIVAGGSLFTHEYERFPEVDHFVLNEAEITLPLFLSDLQSNSLRHVYKTDAFTDMSQSPLPALELAEMDHYLYSIVQFSRGCPHMCDFCDVTALVGRVPRTKTAAQIIHELDAIHLQSKTQLVLFADDNLIGNRKFLKDELLPAIIDWRKKKKPSFFFATQLTINLADDAELMKQLIDAGFRHIFVGIETPEEASLMASGKNQNLKRNQLENIHALHRAGFIVSGGFIVGFDTDSKSVFEQQAAFIQQSGIPLPIVNVLKAPPGTALHDRMEKEGRINKTFAFSEGDTNFIPAMGEECLKEGFLRLTEEIYSPDNSCQRLLNFFEIYRYPKTSVKVNSKFDIRDILKGIRIAFRLSFKKSYNRSFRRLIWWVVRHNYKHLDKAFFYSIMIFQMHQTFLHIKKQFTEKQS